MPREKADFIIENVYDSHKVEEVKQVINALHGVSSVVVDQTHNLVSIEYDSSGTSYDQIENQINKMGFEIAADASIINTR